MFLRHLVQILPSNGNPAISLEFRLGTEVAFLPKVKVKGTATAKEIYKESNKER